MLKTNNKRPPVIINLRQTPTGFQVENQSIKKVVRPPPRTDLMQDNRFLSNQPKLGEKMDNGTNRNFGLPFLNPNSTIIPPQHTTLPISASWFDINNVHQIEKEALPQFFKNSNRINLFSKSEQQYKYYRNSMIAMWKQNTKKYLPASICRKNLLGDACAIMRVHAFLQDWGLINFPSKQNKGIAINKDMRVQCSICSNKFYVFYVFSGLQQLLHVCQKCFQQQNYPILLKNERFMKIDIREEIPQQNKWTQAETLKLLQNINNYKQNWSDISKDFPNKSKQSLVLHFLKLPAQKISNTHIFENGEDIYGSSKPNKNPTIFQDYKNPIQSSIAILNAIYKEDPNKYKQIGDIMQAAQNHTKYLLNRQEEKLDKLIKMITDFTMNKIENKLVYLQEYSNVVNSQSQYIQELYANQIGEILKESMI